MEQAKQMGYTIFRVFAGVIIASLIADLTNLLDFHWEDWKPVIIAGIAAALVVVGNYFNPEETRYGIGA